MQTAISSKKGLRVENQDLAASVYNKSHQHLGILCDGMGGHKGGAVASYLAVNLLVQTFEQTDKFSNQDQAQSWLEQELQAINKKIYAKGVNDQTLYGMGTTMVVALLLDDSMLIANVGDSRAYTMKSNRLKQITIDHSFANEMYRSGKLNREEAQRHPQKHALTRVIGQEAPVEVDFFLIDVRDVSYILLCSDGLSNFLEEQEILKVLEEPLPLKIQAEQLTCSAIQQGSNDNVTVFLTNLSIEKRDD